MAAEQEGRALPPLPTSTIPSKPQCYPMHLLLVDVTLKLKSSYSETHLDVGVQGVRPKDGAGPLVALHAILLEGCDVAGVCVCEARYNHMHILAPDSLHLRSTPHTPLSCCSRGRFQTAMTALPAVQHLQRTCNLSWMQACLQQGSS